MVNKQKVKGSAWENQVVDLLNKLVEGAEFKRVVGSGAIGTQMHEPLLMGDVRGSVDGFYKKFRAECKAGYNNSTNSEVKQFTLKKEWLDKIKAEAELVNAIPVLFGKFDNARSGVKHFAVLDLNMFVEFLNEYSELKRDYDKLFAYVQENMKK